ncbi:GTPase HflX [Candidatus Halobeggiatoa sp. HSG11]|nr:GTPase HflX [Candidatus Halobeggiatoa sp. HSG11]
MFERPHGGERAILVSVNLVSSDDQNSSEEFTELACSAGVIVVFELTATRKKPEPHSFIGSGKLQELSELVIAHQVEVVLFNHILSPGQERNLERVLQCKVLDRTGVILDIFAQRASSFEGKLQVELAQLKHLSTRLIRGWTHLERQKGGIGLRGPGETQLETDRRLIGNRIKSINKRLGKVTQQRELSRKARLQAQLPIVSLVGYTNAGKSTLFNLLTKSDVLVADQLFATLDATLRRLVLPNKMRLVLADTVGFVQNLPHDLIAAFRATLEETRQASLLLHVVDASDPERQLRIEQVNQVLADIGAADIPQIMVYNKIDRLFDCQSRCNQVENRITVWLSALDNIGIGYLYEILAKQLSLGTTHCQVRIPVNAGDLRASLFKDAVVLQEQYTDNGDSLLEIQIATQLFNHLTKTDLRLQLIKS